MDDEVKKLMNKNKLLQKEAHTYFVSLVSLRARYATLMEFCHSKGLAVEAQDYVAQKLSESED